jgi:hypothetical protein
VRDSDGGELGALNHQPGERDHAHRWAVYRVVLDFSGRTGTYTLRLRAPDTFDVALPASISDGVPGAGAGNLETETAEDVYRFSISSSTTLQIDVSACQWTGIGWQLINADTGAFVRSAVGCSSTSVPNVPAGN